MTDKEKLIELISEVQYMGGLEAKLADHLFANGVTVQKWIPVTERLPEDDTPVIICTDKNFLYAGTLIGGTWFLDNDCWTENVTHWMPMPEPPKVQA